MGTPSGKFVESAGYYEGTPEFEDIETAEPCTYFVCTEAWSWVKLESYYIFNVTEVESNIESHTFSAELNGCYAGAF